MTQTDNWWQKTTIYQIYPRSFYDSNGDGIGDIKGIISKLDYIQDLGFETIWISPFFCSPQQDFGYDVSDYTDIAPEYGALADVESLIDAVHARGMRVLFDLVLNHTSIQHPWFKESRLSKNNPKRDWYIWRDGRDNHPPNNWKSIPGGSAWHYDPETEQYYYASFLPFQPDLNWRNPEVKDAMFDMVRFWLEKGIDGFRLDIFHSIFKDLRFRNNPFSFHYIPKDDQVGFFQRWKYSLKQPEVYELAKELRGLVDSYSPQRMVIGEVFGSVEEEKMFLGDQGDGLHLIFLWGLLNLKGTASFLRNVIRHYETHFPKPFTPVYVFGNHDRKRVLSLVGDEPIMAKLLALFQFTTRGVPVTYYGEEIGMLDGGFPAVNALDPIGLKYKHIPEFIINGLGLYVNRDGCRTPMQWTPDLNAGFSGPEATPWLPVHENRSWANVADQQEVMTSILGTYKALLRIREDVEVLRIGDLKLLDGLGIYKNLLVYVRENEGDIVLVVINFGLQSVEYQNDTGCNQVLLSVGMENPKDTNKIQLPTLSGIVLKT